MIAPARSAADLASTRELFLEYATDLGFDLCFQGFDAELASLPGRYAPPLGVILLAREPDGLAGCVALRPLDTTAGRCEMKRMYVRPAFRRRGLGRALAVAVLDAARVAGHDEMVLDTLAHMSGAIALYESLGFRQIPPYTPNPLPGPVFFGLDLRPARPPAAPPETSRSPDRR